MISSGTQIYNNQLNISYDSNVISAYISHWTKRAYPLGLIPGLRVQLSNMVKVISKKGHGYLVSTVFTNILVLDTQGIGINKLCVEALPETKVDKFRAKPLIEHCIKQLYKTQQNLEMFECLMTLEVINKISITAICKSCGSNFSNGGSCSFVGCHIPVNERMVEFKCSANFQMEDETYGANVYVNDLNICRNILYMFSDSEWELILKTAEQKGEIVYLSKRKKRAIENCSDRMIDIYAGTQACFTMFCEIYPLTNYSQFLCKLRPFSNGKQSQSIHWNNDQLNFICLGAKPN